LKPGDRLVCALIETAHVGATFRDWPLHVTIVPWFRISTESENLTITLREAIGDIPAFKAKIVKENVYFGHQKNKRASLIGQPSPFTAIETRIRRLLHTYGAWIVDESTKLRREYTPHVTVQQSQGLSTGDTFWCHQLYIIEQKGGHKRIAGLVGLRND